jgi:MerR family copper efflux transcriptional regulator
MKATLEHLVHCCQGDDRPDCPIIENLANEATAPGPAAAAGARTRTHGLRSGR